MASSESEHIKIYCACGAGLKLPPTAIGKKIKCPKCGSVFVAEEEESPFSLAPLDTFDEEVAAKAQQARKIEQERLEHANASGKPGTPCPLCGKSIAHGAVMCVACGYDSRTGRRVGKANASVSAATRLVKSAGTFLLGCVLSGVGALLGASLWLIIGIMTNYEIGWIAWILGLLAGAGMTIGYRQHNTRAGITAACIALGGILLGKAAFIVFLIYTFTTGDTEDIQLLRGHLIQRYTDEELSKRGIWDPEERIQQAPELAAEAERRVSRMKDVEVQQVVQGFRDDEAALEESFSEVGLLRSRIAWHDAEREAEATGLKWNDGERDRIAEKNERKLKLLPESHLRDRERELDAWEKDGRFADAQYVQDRLAYEFVEEDLRLDPPADWKGMEDLDVEDWDVPDKVWKEYYQAAMEDVKELTGEERVSKLKEMESQREDDQIRGRLAYHRATLQANREGISIYDWERRTAQREKQSKELDALTHEQLAEEAARLDQWEKDGKEKDSDYLRDQLIYTEVEIEMEKRRGQLSESEDDSYWTPDQSEWQKLYADASSKVDSIPADDYGPKLREAELEHQRISTERFAAAQREEGTRLAGSLARFFFMSMLTPLNIIFLLLALSTAYRVGSRGFSKE